MRHVNITVTVHLDLCRLRNTRLWACYIPKQSQALLVGGMLQCVYAS
jgi:hypothetical protein